MDDITESQKEALDRVRDIMKEHFECHVIGYHTEISDRSYAHGVEYSGPIMSCLGIATYVEGKIKAISIAPDIEY